MTLSIHMKGISRLSGRDEVRRSRRTMRIEANLQHDRQSLDKTKTETHDATRIAECGVQVVVQESL